MIDPREARDTWIEPNPEKFLSEAVPAVFLFQPKFQRLETPEELAEWERLTAEKVGLQLSAAARESWTATLGISGKPPNEYDMSDVDTT